MYRLSLTSLILFIAGAQAFAQTSVQWTRPVRILIGAAPGGALDPAARAISDRLGKALGQSIIVDSRPAVGGNVAAQILAKAAPDGYTLLLGAPGNLAVNYSLYKNIGYHPLQDFSPVTMVTDATNILVVYPSLAPKSVAELITLARAQPGKLTYGSSGAGNAPHLAGVLFTRMAKVEMTHIPYKGGGPAMLDLIGGRIDMIFAAPPPASPQIKAGRVRALAVTTLRRSPLVPDLPTLAESGLPGYEVSNWFALVAPAKTPRPLIDRLNREVVAILSLAEVKETLLNQGLEAIPSTPEAARSYMQSEFKKWAQVVAEEGLSAQ